uniref:Uncharacterized protein n=1 Tax=Sphaerodactylus townsendi TaxID=933632 RepID=A0ACB8EFW8_9SAUR
MVKLALKWVKENAASFGGDPARVTISGQSAGAASVGFHLLCPGSQPLFAQAILQSGSVNAIWAWVTPEEAEQKALAFGQALGCPQDNDTDVVTCLQGKDVSSFHKYELSALNSTMLLNLPFSPTIDGEFLLEDPQKLLEPGRIPNKPILVGTTSDEGSMFVPFTFPEAKDGLITWKQLVEGVKRTVRRATEEVIQAVARKYSEEDHGPASYRRAMVQSSSDYFFVCPVAEIAAKLTEAGSPVYSYFFSQYTLGSAWPEWVGATHGAELPYLFGSFKTFLAANQTLTEAEAALSRRVKQYWAEFARFG